MGILITWPAQRRRRPASASRSGDAKILFFTGIRYVRELDATDPTAAQIAGPAGGTDTQALAAM